MYYSQGDVVGILRNIDNHLMITCDAREHRTVCALDDDDGGGDSGGGEKREDNGSEEGDGSGRAWLRCEHMRQMLTFLRDTILQCYKCC